jgi:hypothetical protein
MSQEKVAHAWRNLMAQKVLPIVVEQKEVHASVVADVAGKLPQSVKASSLEYISGSPLHLLPLAQLRDPEWLRIGNLLPTV